jgi:hypothetical protein
MSVIIDGEVVRAGRGTGGKIATSGDRTSSRYVRARDRPPPMIDGTDLGIDGGMQNTTSVPR